MSKKIILGGEFWFESLTEKEARARMLIPQLAVRRRRGWHVPTSVRERQAERWQGSHDYVAGPYGMGEGEMLARLIEDMPDAVLVESGKGMISVLRPADRLKPVPPETEEDV